MAVEIALLTGSMETALSGSRVEPKINPTGDGYGKLEMITVTKTFPLLTPTEGETD